MVEKTSASLPRRPVRGVSPILLGNCPQLANLDTKVLVRLSKLAESRLIVEEERLFDQGDSADSIFILLDGAINLRRSNQDGTSSEYKVVAPYATFGDVVLLGETERRYEVTAELDSLVVELPLAPLVDALSSDAPLALAWRSAVLARLHRKEPDQAATFGWKLLDKISKLFDAA